MYYDGANFGNPWQKDPGRMGFDAVHYNLHKPSVSHMAAEVQKRAN